MTVENQPMITPVEEQPKATPTHARWFKPDAVTTPLVDRPAIKGSELISEAPKMTCTQPECLCTFFGFPCLMSDHLVMSDHLDKKICSWTCLKYSLLEELAGCVAADRFALDKHIEDTWSARCAVCWCLPCSLMTIKRRFAPEAEPSVVQEEGRSQDKGLVF